MEILEHRQVAAVSGGPLQRDSAYVDNNARSTLAVILYRR